MKKEQLTAAIILILAGIISGFLSHWEKNCPDSYPHQSVITLKHTSSKVEKLDLETIKSVGDTVFTARSKDGTFQYRGILIKDLFKYLNIAADNKKEIIVKGHDGYTVTFTYDEIQMDDNVYIVYERDKKLLGKMQNGGLGPYLVIVKKDQYYSRWCKGVVEIKVLQKPVPTV